MLGTDASLSRPTTSTETYGAAEWCGCCLSRLCEEAEGGAGAGEPTAGVRGCHMVHICCFAISKPTTRTLHNHSQQHELRVCFQELCVASKMATRSKFGECQRAVSTLVSEITFSGSSRVASCVHTVAHAAQQMCTGFYRLVSTPVSRFYADFAPISRADFALVCADFALILRFSRVVSQPASF